MATVAIVTPKTCVPGRSLADHDGTVAGVLSSPMVSGTCTIHHAVADGGRTVAGTLRVWSLLSYYPPIIR